jgi:hypothetical protein
VSGFKFIGFRSVFMFSLVEGRGVSFGFITLSSSKFFFLRCNEHLVF